jgi:hypothetical protein
MALVAPSERRVVELSNDKNFSSATIGFLKDEYCLLPDLREKGYTLLEMKYV